MSERRPFTGIPEVAEPLVIPYDKAFALTDIPFDTLSADEYTPLPGYQLRAHAFDVGLVTPRIIKTRYDHTLEFDLKLSPEYLLRMANFQPQLKAIVPFQKGDNRIYVSDAEPSPEQPERHLYHLWELPEIPLIQYGLSNIRALYPNNEPVTNPLILNTAQLNKSRFQFSLVRR